jgi:hypothetical protein
VLNVLRPGVSWPQLQLVDVLIACIVQVVGYKLVPPSAKGSFCGTLLLAVGDREDHPTFSSISWHDRNTAHVWS